MVNGWIAHVKDFQSKHPELSYKECMQKSRSSYKPVKGRGIDDVLDETNKVDDLLKVADTGLSFTTGVLQDPTRIRRVEMRQDARAERRSDLQDRVSQEKQATTDRVVAKKSIKTNKINRSQELKDAKLQKKLNKIL